LKVRYGSVVLFGMRKSGKILWLCLILVLGASPAHAEDKTMFRAREGAAALLRGQYDKAITAYDEVLATPEIADFVKAAAYSDRGVAKWRLKRTTEAVDDFNLSIQISPENATVYNNRGNALMDLGHPEEAVRDFDRAIALSPNYGAAYNNRGNARTALSQFEPAFHDFRKATELMPTSAVPFNGRGKAHAALNRHHAAIRDFTRALNLNNKYESALRNRGEAYLAVEQYDQAADDLTQVLASTPDQPDVLLLRARAYIASKKFNPAQADLDKLIALKPELVDAFIERGILFTDVRRFDPAIADLTHAIELDPKNVRAYAMLASAKLQSGDNEGALQDVNSGLTISPGDPQSLLTRGSIYEAQERTSDAIEDYKNVLAKDPFETTSRDSLARLGQEVPQEQGDALAAPISGWVIKEPAKGRYIASNPKYPSLRADLEMFGSGKPKILEWSLLKDALAGIGLLRYYAGDLGDGQGTSLEYVAIVDTYANKVVSIEPHAWGANEAQWNWQSISVVVTDPDGNANEVKLRKPKVVRAPRDDGDFFGFGGQADARSGGARRGGGREGGTFNWLFR
jgi:tetratricopeptide (TPR) repeat protein